MNEHIITDVHTHCIWGVDDGPISEDMTMEIIADMYRQGVRRIVATSHGNIYSRYPYKYIERFTRLQARLKESYPDIKLATGNEIKVYKGQAGMIKDLLNNNILYHMGVSDYVLIELSIKNTLEQNISIMREILDIGIQPIIAHTERYPNFAGNISSIESLVNDGVKIQINAYSLEKELQENVKARARELIKHRLVHFIGSDGHRTTHRPPVLSAGVEWLFNNTDKEYAEAVTYKNADVFFDSVSI